VANRRVIAVFKCVFTYRVRLFLFNLLVGLVNARVQQDAHTPHDGLPADLPSNILSAVGRARTVGLYEHDVKHCSIQL
jgi:hypothetical protein